MNSYMNPQLESWPRCPEAARFFRETLNRFISANPSIGAMADRSLSDAGVDLFVLVDHWILPAGASDELAAIGMNPAMTLDGDPYWEHPRARLPRVRIDRSRVEPRLALGVENIDLFLQVNGLSPCAREGDVCSNYEIARCRLESGELHAVARRGYGGFRPGTLTAPAAREIERIRSLFETRKRAGEEQFVQQHLSSVLESAAGAIGLDRAVDEFFGVEREFYQGRNRAANWQYARQQRLGLGWSNHDHHTYRSSRAGFRGLMRLWDQIGFRTRERFYAGAEAGWGAQILEHPVSRVVLFCDVDLAPEELALDFAAGDLGPLQSLGTIGLWCELHGSSIAAAGMHHLEAEYDFDQIRRNLAAGAFEMMAPFTDLPMLKQAFTAPEIWPVDPDRIERLTVAGSITADEAARFRSHGAPGSHLEVLQRWEGFKGFNKTGVSAIIRKTDARL